MEGADLQQVELVNANLSKANLANSNFSGADLRGAKLNQADLTGSYLEHTKFSGADLSGAHLDGSHAYYADLSDASLNHTSMFGADLVKANLTNTDLYEAELGKAHLFNADLSDARMAGSRLGGADLEIANLTRAMLVGADLTGVDARHSDLTGADLSGANLAGAVFIETELKDASLDGSRVTLLTFEPRSNPPVRRMASAVGLSSMTFQDKPDALVQLQKQFQEAGFRDQERMVTYALNRRIAALGTFAERHFKRVAFDLTCQYGMSPFRPLILTMISVFLFALVYYFLMRTRGGSSGIYRLRKRQREGKEFTAQARVWFRPTPMKSNSYLKYALIRQYRMIRAAIFFSLMSATNIGFREIDFGRWLRMLTTKEYDFRAVGWARTISGLQSLISLYLIALSVLAIFGRPF